MPSRWARYQACGTRLELLGPRYHTLRTSTMAGMNDIGAAKHAPHVQSRHNSVPSIW
jgi:hypothetical protein